MKTFLSLLIGYLIGCLNAAYFISKLKGKDIKRYGTGNAGAGNVGYTFGIKYAIIVGVFDIIKAIGAYHICAAAFDNVLFGQVAGFGCILGHNHPFFMGFDGGKGFASLMGFLAAYSLPLALIMLVFHLIAVLSTKHMVMGSFAVMIGAPIAACILKDWQFALIITITVLFMTYRHIPNIKCLLAGTEPKISDVGKAQKKQ